MAKQNFFAGLAVSGWPMFLYLSRNIANRGRTDSLLSDSLYIAAVDTTENVAYRMAQENSDGDYEPVSGESVVYESIEERTGETAQVGRVGSRRHEYCWMVQNSTASTSHDQVLSTTSTSRDQVLSGEYI